MVLQTNGPVNTMVGSSFAPTSLQDLLVQTDLVVRGTVGAKTFSYLSADETDVLTDYRLESVGIIFPVSAASTPRPGVKPPPITLTQLGGTTVIEGHQVSVDHTCLRPLAPRTDAIFLLTRSGEKYRLAFEYLGVFAIENGSIHPLCECGAFSANYRGKALDDFVADIVAILGGGQR
jgi:hypothetical protein